MNLKYVTLPYDGILVVSEAKILKDSNYPKLDVTVAIESECF
jgi:hypothetical protein